MSDHNKSDHQNKNWTFFPIVPFCLGGLRREPGVSGRRRVRPVVLISPEYGRGSRRPAPDMEIIMMYVVTIIIREGYWTKSPECPGARGINPEPGTGQRRSARSAVILVQNYCSGRSRSVCWPTAAPGCRRFNFLLFYSGLVTLPDEKHH